MGKRKWFYDENIFDVIDSKEKAYWHGYISADGHVNKTGIYLEAKSDDIWFMDNMIKFINADQSMIKSRHRMSDEYHYKRDEYSYVSLSLHSAKIANDYIKHFDQNINFGKKSDRLRLPDFVDDSFTLAWMLGYYDGDGFQDNHRICSGSYDLLADIKEKYSLNFDITNPNDGVYVLYIGSSLRHRMCESYPNSLPRKRFASKINVSGNKNKITPNISIDTLKCLVKTHSLQEIGVMFGISRQVVYGLTKRNDITIPRKTTHTKSTKKHTCEFYPCHESVQSCVFCYCPLYTLTCGEEFIILPNGVKDCSNCTFPHEKSNHDEIIRRLTDVPTDRSN